MKIGILLFFIFTLLASVTYSQQAKTVAETQEKELKSKTEEFSAKSGTLIQKEFIDIGTIKGCQLQIINLIDLIAGDKTSGVRFEYRSAYSSDTKSAFLDADELDGLIKSIKIIQERILPTAPLNYTEVSYKSRSGFQAGCFQGKKEWSAYLKLESFDNNSYVFLNRDDLDKVLSFLSIIKEKL